MNRIYKQQIQNYLLAMVTKLLKYPLLILLMTTLTGCPGDEDCNDLGSSTRVNDLIILTPLQNNYNQGDVITLKIVIPPNNTFFGEPLNLFEKTNNNYEAYIETSYSWLFTGNILTFINGSQGSETNNFIAIYNNLNECYEFEVDIKLNKTGNYTIVTDDSIIFQGNSSCNRYFLNSNILGANSEDVIQFTVQ